MNPFDYLVEDIFNSSDFVEYCYINGRKTKCISSSIATDTNFTPFGIDDGISFYLQVKRSDYTPKKSDKVIYKDQQYKVDTYTLDSVGKTYSVFLKSQSSK